MSISRNTRRLIIAGSAIFMVLSCNSIRTEVPETELNASADRPNIIWIVGENLNLDLGIYGAENVFTPNLDSLGEKGVRYTHVFSTSPVCAPSRSASRALCKAPRRPDYP